MQGKGGTHRGLVKRDRKRQEGKDSQTLFFSGHFGPDVNLLHRLLWNYYQCKLHIS